MKTMIRCLKIFIVAFVLTFIALAVLDSPPVKQYIQAQADQARQEMFQMRMRYAAATRGI